MNEKLAKKLRDIGFPQNKTEYILRKYKLATNPMKLRRAQLESTRSGKKQEGIEWEIAYPTLSELIEECGDGFWGLTKHSGIWQTNWINGMAGDTAGKTPEEAVTELYKALHTK